MSIGKSPGLIRRLSNRATQFAGRRRQSSTAARSRDHSTGPVIMRRRSDSNSTAPDGARPSLYTDSDEDIEELDDLSETFGIETSRDVQSTYGSIAASSLMEGIDGPVIPAMLLNGTTMTKVSRKKRKTLTLVLDSEAAKVSWDKNRPSKSFFIDDVKEVRTGVDASNYRQEFGLPASDEPRFFSILYALPDKSKGRSTKLMHLIAHDDQSFEYWTSTLDAVSKHRHEFMAALSSFNDKAVKTYWRREMSKQFGERPRREEDEEIDLTGVESLCRNLHINVSKNYLREKFSAADATNTGRLNFIEFQDFVKLMKRREDVYTIYRGITGNLDKGLTQAEFFSFLRDIQGESIDDNISHWETVFAKFARRSRSKGTMLQDQSETEAPTMTESALAGFLTSTYNLPMAELPAQFSLDRPLNEYFISSSHNTYLLGRQVAGQSSVEAYVSSLIKGCRCVEVDCWNGSEGPVVMHGRTLTSQISFADVMATISKYAFVASNFPLWISLEVHCNPVQQKMMADIIKATCGDKLVTKPLEENATSFPTPMQLLNRILIKVKVPKRVDEAVIVDSPSGRRRGNSLTSPFARAVQLDNTSIPASLLQQSPPMSPQQRPHRLHRVLSRSQLRVSHANDGLEGLSSGTSDSDSFEEARGTSETTKRGKTSKIVPVLGDLGVYCAGLKFAGFDAQEAKAYNHIFSFSEDTFKKHSTKPEDKRALVRHNMRHLMRVYPNQTRVSSNNFDPLTYWRRGVQMAALNWQTYDLGMQMNEAMFAAGTDRSGYVLKPAELRGPMRVSDNPEASSNGTIKRERKNVTFSIDVISAQQLMRPRSLGTTRTVDPYVEVEVYHADDKTKEHKGVTGEGGLDASRGDGTSGLGAPHKRQTHIVQGNGFNPVFNKKFNFQLTTKYPELVFIRWIVRASPDGQQYSDNKASVIATYTAKLSSIKQGYRTLPLMDHHGDQFLFSTLFCHIRVGEATSQFFDGLESPLASVGVLKTIGHKVFNRRDQLSPRLTSEITS
jgi:phosphatidylinositol phospholipase C delta